LQKIFSAGVLSQYFLVPLWPAFGEAIALKDYNWIKRTLIRALGFSILLGIFTSALLYFCVNQILVNWIDPKLTSDAYLRLGFCAWLLVCSLANPISAYINSSPVVRQLIPFSAVSAILSLCLKLSLTSYLGLSSVIWISVSSYAVLFLIPSIAIAGNSIQKQQKTLIN
jgi:O-antigen/teichoic acid export membrane protein